LYQNSCSDCLPKSLAVSHLTQVVADAAHKFEEILHMGKFHWSKWGSRLHRVVIWVSSCWWCKNPQQLFFFFFPTGKILARRSWASISYKNSFLRFSWLQGRKNCTNYSVSAFFLPFFRWFILSIGCLPFGPCPFCPHVLNPNSELQCFWFFSPVFSVVHFEYWMLTIWTLSFLSSCAKS
jgi:hypothetical protein